MEPELLRDLKAIHGNEEGSKMYLKYTNQKPSKESIELKNNLELVDLFADALKKRIKSGKVSFMENNEWLKNPNFDEIDTAFRMALIDNDPIDMAIYLSMEWYHNKTNIGE